MTRRALNAADDIGRTPDADWLAAIDPNFTSVPGVQGGGAAHEVAALRCDRHFRIDRLAPGEQSVQGSVTARPRRASRA